LGFDSLALRRSRGAGTTKFDADRAGRVNLPAASRPPFQDHD
jgi:hypothetical protein